MVDRGSNRVPTVEETERHQSILTVEEVARYLRVHEQTVYHLLRTGRLKGTKVGRAWRIHRNVLEAFMNAGGGSEQSYLEKAKGQPVAGSPNRSA